MHPNDVLLDGTRQQGLVYHVVMARRKPATQPTGIIDVVKDIVSPWLGAPPAQNKQVTQAQGLARAAAETLDQTFAGGLVKAGVQGNKALVKQAAVNAAALGAGYIAGKAAVTAAGAAAKTGVIPATIRSVIGRDETYFVHGSPTKGIKKLDPKYELQEQYINAEPYFAERWPGGIDERSVPAIYGNPLKQSGGGRRYANQLVPMRELRESVYDSKGYAGKYGSLYVAKVPKNKFYDQYTENPAKVIREIDVTNLSNKEALTKTLDTLKKLGFKQPKKR